MKIIVCVKQVPDTVNVKIDPETKNLVRDGVPGIINPFDRNGVEEALRIRDQVGGTVVAVGMGPPQAEKTLKQCLAMGADEAVLLCDRKLSGSDTLATSYALAETIREIGYDLVICGAEAVDGCTGQVGPEIAEHLGVAQITGAVKLKVEDGALTVHKDAQDQIEVYRVALPAVVCVLRGINTPRGERENCAKQFRVMDASHLDKGRVGLEGSATRVVQITVAGSRAKSYVDVDEELSCEERIDYIMRGGMTQKKINLHRGDPDQMAEAVLHALR